MKTAADAEAVIEHLFRVDFPVRGQTQVYFTGPLEPVIIVAEIRKDHQIAIFEKGTGAAKRVAMLFGFKDAVLFLSKRLLGDPATWNEIVAGIAEGKVWPPTDGYAYFRKSG